MRIPNLYDKGNPPERQDEAPDVEHLDQLDHPPVRVEQGGEHEQGQCEQPVILKPAEQLLVKGSKQYRITNRRDQHKRHGNHRKCDRHADKQANKKDTNSSHQASPAFDVGAISLTAA